MKFRTLSIGYVLVLAVFLFAQRKTVAPQQSSLLASALPLNLGSSAAASVLDRLPQDRISAPLVVLDVRSHAREDSPYEISVNDIADWEQEHGEIPPGAFVVARTGSAKRELPDSTSTPKSARYSADAALFLIEGRNVLGLGTEAPAPHPATVRGGREIYQLASISNLDAVPVSGTFAVLANLQSHKPALYALLQ